MQIEDYFYVNYKNKKYPVVGVSFDENDRRTLKSEPYSYMLFGDVSLARALEPYETDEQTHIDNQITYYFDNNVCQKYIEGLLPEAQLFENVKEAIMSW